MARREPKIRPNPVELQRIQTLRAHWAADRRKFFADCLRIRHRDEAGLGPLLLNPAQESLLRLIEKIEQFNVERTKEHSAASHLPVDVVIVKPRKEGISTFIEALAFHLCEFRPLTNALIMAHRKDGAQNIGMISRRFVFGWPKELTHYKIPMNSKGKDLIEWSLGDNDDPAWDSRMIIVTGKDEGVARGFDFDFVHISEVAHFDSPDSISAAKNAMLKQHYCFEESTANGVDHSFYASFTGAMFFDDVYKHWKETGRTPEGWNGKYRFFWAWWQDPGYSTEVSEAESEWLSNNLDEEELELVNRFGLSMGQIKWRRVTITTKCSEQTRMTAEDFFKQEYPSYWEEAFVRSENSVFDHAKLLVMDRHSSKSEPKWHGQLQNIGDAKTPNFIPIASKSGKHKGSPLLIWQDPIQGHSYVIGSDTAEGRKDAKDGDYSVAMVFDRGDGTRLREVASLRCKAEPREFGDMINWLYRKYNGAYLIPEANPPGNATCQRLLELGCFNIYMRKNEDVLGETPRDDVMKAGFKTMTNTRPLIISMTQAALKSNQLVIFTRQAIAEFMNFTNNDGRLEHQPGGHDDCVFATALAVYGHFKAAPPVLIPKTVEVNEEEIRAEVESKLWAQVRAKVAKSHRLNERKKKFETTRRRVLDARKILF